MEILTNNLIKTNQEFISVSLENEQFVYRSFENGFFINSDNEYYNSIYNLITKTRTFRFIEEEGNLLFSNHDDECMAIDCEMPVLSSAFEFKEDKFSRAYKQSGFFVLYNQNNEWQSWSSIKFVFTNEAEKQALWENAIEQRKQRVRP